MIFVLLLTFLFDVSEYDLSMIWNVQCLCDDDVFDEEDEDGDDEGDMFLCIFS